MNTHFGRELGQRLFQRYGSRDQWPENLAMASASLQLLQQYLDADAFEALLTCANEAHADLEEYRARTSALRATIAELRTQR
ncbi:hypothetical protein ABT224_19595 [Streptomyces sp. NPDC001584]|uniref:hypothetical protein n=1 Tax=Streptomyces sp. NPDC001584 TaxID=3154521 RepID=UPI003319335D